MDNCKKTKFIRQTAPSYSDITEMERLCSGSGTIRERPAAKKGLISPTFYVQLSQAQIPKVQKRLTA